MSPLEVTIKLALLAVLTSYLWLKHRQRVRNWSPKCDPAQWTGQGIDVTQLKPKVETVRRDYVAARRPATGVCFHRALLTMARRAVAQLGFFQHREPQAQAPRHGP